MAGAALKVDQQKTIRNLYDSVLFRKVVSGKEKMQFDRNYFLPAKPSALRFSQMARTELWPPGRRLMAASFCDSQTDSRVRWSLKLVGNLNPGYIPRRIR